MKYILIALIVLACGCSKGNDASPKAETVSIVGTWHLRWEYALNHGVDTIYSESHPLSDNSYAVAINSDGKAALLTDQTDFEYYKVVGDTLYFSDDPLPDNAHTWVGVEHDENPDSIYHTGEIQGWHIDKLTTDSMALSMFGLETTDSYTYDIFVK